MILEDVPIGLWYNFTVKEIIKNELISIYSTSKVAIFAKQAIFEGFYFPKFKLIPSKWFQNLFFVSFTINPC